MVRYSLFIIIFCIFLFSCSFAESPDALKAEADSLKVLGNSLLEQAEYDQALSVFTQELKTRQLLSDSIGEARTFNNIGSTYFQKGWNYYDQALEYYEKALEILISVLGYNHPDVAKSYNNIGTVYRSQGDYDQALEFSKKSLA